IPRSGLHLLVLLHHAPPAETYTLSLHDALPISLPGRDRDRRPPWPRVAQGRRAACSTARPEGPGRERRRRDRPLPARPLRALWRSEEHTSELQSRSDLVCRLLLEKKKNKPVRRT